jgi:hypothetical protein
VKTEAEAPPFLERRRLGHGVAQRLRRGVHEAIFDPQISGEDVVFDGVHRDLAKEAVAEDCVPRST